MILVTGPRLAGSSTLLAALRTRLPEYAFVETTSEPNPPAAVIFVASAVAPLTPSDCTLLDAAVEDADVVIGAVSKIDVHLRWREVLAADEELAAAYNARYAGMVWAGVAAAPLHGEPQLDEVVAALERALARPSRLRARQHRLRHALRCHEDAAVHRSARIPVLRQQRSEALRRQRAATSEETIRLRSKIHHARVQLLYSARSRWASARSEFTADAVAVGRRGMPAFQEHVVKRISDVYAEVCTAVSEQLADLGLTVAADPPPKPPITRPALAADGLETRLMMLLGAVLGGGVALTLSRLFADVAPAYSVAGAAMGLAVAVWVFGMRRTLRDRAALDRWVADVVSEARAALEQHVTTRILHTEAALLTQLARCRDDESAAAAERLGVIDDELGEHAAEAAKMRRELPSLRRALEAVEQELNRSCE